MTTEHDMEGLLQDLGIELGRSTDWEVYGICPGHERILGRKDRRPTTWSVARTTGNHFCLAAETEVITWEGVFPIKELAGHEVRLLTPSGWTLAPVRSFGEQALWDVVVRRNGVRKTIRATPEHRWMVQVSKRSGGRERQERQTQELRPGMRLSTVSAPYRSASPSPWGVAHGISYGDGTRVPTGCRLDLHGGKDAPLLEFFPLSPRSEQVSTSGGRFTQVYGLPALWKETPSLDESPSYLLGWLAGYFAADGCVSEDGMPILASADRSALEFVELVCHRLGIWTNGVRSQERLGRGSAPTPLYFLTFGRSSLRPEFFLLPEHRRRFEANRDVKERRGWVVESVTPTDTVEEVYCAEVPEDHAFGLAGNILTGNCFSCGYGGTLVDLIMEHKGGTVWGAIKRMRDHGIDPADPDDLPESFFEKRRRCATAAPDHVSEAELERFVDVPSRELRRRDIELASARHYGVCWNPKQDAWVTPIRLVGGALIGWQEKGKGYFLNKPDKVPKSHTLFGVDRLANDTTAILVESPLDVCRIHTAGFEGAVSSFGVYVSADQMRLLLSVTDELILALDNDEPGRKEIHHLLTGDPRTPKGRKGIPWLAKFADVRVFNYGRSEAKDPGEMTDDEIEWGIEHATPAEDWSTT